jgi:hypothetical protein
MLRTLLEWVLQKSKALVLGYSQKHQILQLLVQYRILLA